MSAETSQALLLAGQSDNPALDEAVNRMLPRGLSRPDGVSTLGGGLIGYSLDSAPVQVAPGIFRDPTNGLLSAAAAG